jgi:hypothetical protein
MKKIHVQLIEKTKTKENMVMRKLSYFVIIIIGVLIVTPMANAQNQVTFRVNMAVQHLSGIFGIGTDSVAVRGGFNNWGNSPGSPLWMKKNLSDTVYTAVWTFPDSLVGDTIEYKFFSSNVSASGGPGGGGGWEGDFAPPEGIAGHRWYKLTAGSQVIPTVFFDDVSVVTIVPTQTITFRCDMTVAAQMGYFYPDLDKVWVWGDGIPGGWGPGSQMIQNPLNPGHYILSVSVVQNPGVVLAYTFHTTTTRTTGRPLPYGGYDQGWHNNNYLYTTTGSDQLLDEIFYNGSSAVLTHDVTVIFSVNVRGAINARTGNPFPKVDSVFISGSDGNIGATVPEIAWINSAPWRATDINCKMYDNGTHGDLVAGDSIYSLKVKFLAGSGNNEKFMYNVMYNVGATSGDYYDITNVDQNEQNTVYSANCHEFVIPDSGGVVLRLTTNKFGNYLDTTNVAQITGVKKVLGIPIAFSLDQNYPNPFNPSTIIRYSIPQNGSVTLKVYNVLGEEVATLFDATQKAGVYEAQFNGANFASGVYFYSLHAGNYYSVKKLLLLK